VSLQCAAGIARRGGPGAAGDEKKGTGQWGVLRIPTEYTIGVSEAGGMSVCTARCMGGASLVVEASGAITGAYPRRPDRARGGAAKSACSTWVVLCASLDT
jgi:hypothetical protein